jgi:hypothetical protein
MPKRSLLAFTLLTFLVEAALLSLAAAATSLMFERPPAQGPGTPGFQIVSDPAIRPFQAPGIPATISTTLPIDFQGNWRPDLLACYGYGGSAQGLKLPCRVLRPQPDGSVTDMTRQMFGTGALPSFDNPKEIVTGDFNGDGRPDIFVAASGYDASPWPGATNGLLISNADGTYTDRSSTLPQTPDFSHAARVGDVNGDGRLDIYVGNVFGAGRIGPYFLMGKGDGTFMQKTTGLPPQIQSLQEKFLSCLLVDVDRDGYPDLVLGTHGDGGFVDNIVLFNDGTGDFTRRSRDVLPPWPQHATLDIVAPDINRDAWPDLLVLTSRTDSASGSGLQVLINQRNGTFADETVARLGTSSLVSSGSYCGFVRLADFNGDGWEDFYCNNGPEDVPNRYWTSNPDGTWSPVASGVLPAGSGLGVHAVDFDGDGRPDLLSVYPTGTGDVSYKSYVNRTPRTVPSGPPGAPGTPTASVNGNVVTFSWTAPTTGAPPTYTLLGRLIAGGLVIATLPVGNAASVTVTAPNGTFVVSIQAKNAQGSGPESPGVTFSVPGVPLAPGAPGNFAALVSGSTVNLTWTTPAAGGAPAMYLMVASLTPGSPTIASLPIGANTRNYTVPNVPPGTYYVRLFAQNLGGSGPASNEVLVTVAAPAAPNAPVLNIPQVSGNTVTLTWTPSASGGTPTGFIVRASLAPAGAAIASALSSSPTLTVTGVPLGTYYVTVQATNTVGTSQASNEVTVAVR